MKGMKIACVDHSYHKLTKSFDFARKLLLKHHDIVDFWDEEWEGGKPISIDEINAGDFDAVIFFQYIESTWKLRKLKCKNIIWLPMYDTEIERNINIIELFGYAHLGIKIVSLSQALTNRFKEFKFEILQIHYYPKPNFVEHNEDFLKLFFWQRIKEINWTLIKSILDFGKITEVLFKNNPAVGVKINLPDIKDRKKYNIKVIEGWLDKEKYDSFLNCCDIYIAPREYEGIGMSFLDAMATGSVVVAVDNPTMNEYIVDGFNGYLYDIKNPKKIDFSNFKNIQQNLRSSMEKGFNIWQNEQKSLLNYIEKKPRNQIHTTIISGVIFYLINDCIFLINVLKKIKRSLGIKFY